MAEYGIAAKPSLFEYYFSQIQIFALFNNESTWIKQDGVWYLEIVILKIRKICQL